MDVSNAIGASIKADEALRKDNSAELKKALTEFESLFIGYMLKTMKESVAKGDLFHGGSGEEVYNSLFDAELKAGNLNRKYDVIIVPDDNLGTLTGGGRDDDDPDYPPEYRSGFGDEGIRALEAFVEAGGTLVTFARAGDLAIDGFGLPLRDAVGGLPGREFWSPGSTLRVKVDPTHPLAYGMPEDALATFLAGSQVYETRPSANSQATDRFVTYVDRNVLQSGWLLGEEHLADKAAVVSVEHGEGRVVLIGFRAQHRAQTHGTFKLLFNALVSTGAM